MALALAGARWEPALWASSLSRSRPSWSCPAPGVDPCAKSACPSCRRRAQRLSPPAPSSLRCPSEGLRRRLRLRFGELAIRRRCISSVAPCAPGNCFCWLVLRGHGDGSPRGLQVAGLAQGVLLVPPQRGIDDVQELVGQTSERGAQLCGSPGPLLLVELPAVLQGINRLGLPRYGGRPQASR